MTNKYIAIESDNFEAEIIDNAWMYYIVAEKFNRIHTYILGG